MYTINQEYLGLSCRKAPTKFLMCLLGAWTLWQWHHIWRPHWCSHGEFYIRRFTILAFTQISDKIWLQVCLCEVKLHIYNYVTQGFVWRVQSSEVKKQESANICLHLHFPGIATWISEFPWLLVQISYYLCRMLSTLLPSWGSTLETSRYSQATPHIATHCEFEVLVK